MIMKREIRIPKQKRSIEKKNQIIKAAYRLFNEKGYQKVAKGSYLNI
jgi:AcrR family transcriptional regulator